MFQEVKNITCAANLFIACKVSFTEWRNKIMNFQFMVWQILWQILAWQY